MDELRLVRRDEQSLIVATEAGEEYRLIVDEAVLSELKHLSRQLERAGRASARVNPREVQALVRAGRSRAEIAELTGLEESDIERYEEPVLAERRYMLELAQAVPVRTSPVDDDEQQFGSVIAERLVGLAADGAEWSSWRDEDAGWMIGLEFVSHGVHHRAVWSFEHRKRLLSPLSPDAVTLSKQGDVGDRLIPKLRAVDPHEQRFDSGAFDPERLGSEPGGRPTAGEGREFPASGPVAPDHPSTGSIPIVGLDPDTEFARRQHIEERAIKTPAPELPDLGQTADLLDALRRRRGERDAASAPAEGPDGGGSAPREPLQFPGGGRVAERDRAASPEGDTAEIDELADPVDLERTRPRPAPNPAGETIVVDAAPSRPADAPEAPASPVPRGTADEAEDADGSGSERTNRERGRRGGKGRAAIPSWDEILFGTRSDEDPA